MTEDHPAHNLIFTVQDPESHIRDCPAITTLLYRVCDGNNDKFQRACTLVGLFIEAAYEQGKTDASKSR